MLFQIKTINGQKTIVPLTADAGAGNPVGTIIPMYKKSSPSGYLYCDGSTFDTTAYPLLYAYLDTNVLPDYREFALVGAEENTTDVYNASTNPTGTIHDHDVYTEGEAKDDQLQGHSHTLYIRATTGNPSTDPNVAGGDYSQGTYRHNTGAVVATARAGTVTRGKRKAVYFYIKATSGLSENAQDNVINTLNEQRSYSTTEHKTGKKWIDGKDIYSKSYSIAVANFPYSTGITNVDNVVKLEAIALDQSNNYYTIPFSTVIEGVTYVRNVYFKKESGILYSDGNASPVSITVTLEYTKTND